MTTTSITSSDSFAARAQRSEAMRVGLWAVVLAGMFVLTIARRWSGGMVMAEDKLFFPYAGVLLLGVLCQLILLIVVDHANRRGVLLSPWVWRGAAAFDVAVPAVLLVLAAFLSPRSEERR